MRYRNARNGSIGLLFARDEENLQSHAQLTFAPLYDKASVAKEWSHHFVMYSYEK